eukprot:TRINITY_DN16203_c0_g1_i4.p1 TRINITY_DN16203_c0_g1~~TRINITY_DN16203_c0_g1_i4.p1  ORF type:complete len:346 (+),score=26.04 TRINITY_DN16203_c0_g1_i4:67-1038(+)
MESVWDLTWRDIVHRIGVERLMYLVMHFCIACALVTAALAAVLAAVRYALSEHREDACEAVSLPSVGGAAHIAWTEANSEAYVKCPFGYSYTGPPLSCGWIDLSCPPEAGDSRTRCRYDYGFVPLGMGLHDWPSTLSPNLEQAPARKLAFGEHRKADVPRPESMPRPLRAEVEPLDVIALLECSDAEEKWHSWPQRMIDYCCRQIGTECKINLPEAVTYLQCRPWYHPAVRQLLVHDCDEDMLEWETKWSRDKQEYCCQRHPWAVEMMHGCPSHRAIISEVPDARAKQPFMPVAAQGRGRLAGDVDGDSVQDSGSSDQFAIAS